MAITSGITRATKSDSEWLAAEAKALMETGWWSNYSRAENHCTWPGIRCNAGSVVEIDLGGHGLNGNITPQIGALSELQILNLSSNSLTGELPSSLGNLTQLAVLDLSNNRLVGPIPSSVNNLTNLSSLFLQSNQLNGSIP
ncbi:hypothetical protein Gohar_010062, partial [Gossypium harknessii]|nr:hypothetical protein [Gossypium harknessii]